MAGYVRQSSSQIQSGQPIASAPINNEYDALAAAFSGSSGHGHSGATGDGPPLNATAFGIGSSTAGIVVTTGIVGAFASRTLTGTANQIIVTNGTGASGNPTFSLPTMLVLGGFTVNANTIPAVGLYNPSANTAGIAANTLPVAMFAGVGSAVDYFLFTNAATGSPASLLLAAAGTDTNINISLVPKGSGNVGVAGPLSVSGNAVLNSLGVTNNATVGGTLGVTGSFSVNTSMFTVNALNGNTSVAGTFLATGATTLNSTASISGNTTVGGTFGVTGATTLSSSLSVGTTLGVTGVGTFSSNVTIQGNLTVNGTTNLNGTNPTSINNCPIGNTTPSTGAFTTLSASGTFTGVTGNFSGNITVAGTLSGAGVTALFASPSAIGSTTPAAGSFTTLTASSTLGCTGNFAVATNKFTVAAASGNTLVAGTLGVTGAVTLSSTLTMSALTASGLLGTDASKNLAIITALPSGTTATTQAGTDNSTKVATTAMVQSAVSSVGLGVGQTWQDVSASRSSGTTYTNSTGKPIEVLVGATTAANGTAGTLTVVVGGVTLVPGANMYGGASAGSNFFGFSFIVPNGQTYVVTAGNPGQWVELR